MEIIGFIIVFVILGVVIGSVANGMAIPIIIGISILWAFVYGPWAIATFIELMVGYAISQQKRIVVFLC
jgi:hypothetical protein